ncbi:SDR family NAD(P)-dependent oxidoreductase [Micromonospora sp. CB01531]|uniref:SDR family NAD(P)-dependent oxidoreductase n=1 Tax=Micromonospora sp. CB01531 TaxID=1718947 RepID=UPI00093C958A|nr:SDR family NAD(P)-dependent oxidoreductase [Micromonospora sp. CB01531]
MSEFEGRKGLATDAGSGIGLATAQRLAEAGAHVVIAGRDAARLERSRRGARGGAVPAVRRSSDVTEQELVVDGGLLRSVPLAPMPS